MCLSLIPFVTVVKGTKMGVGVRLLVYIGPYQNEIVYVIVFLNLWFAEEASHSRKFYILIWRNKSFETSVLAVRFSTKIPYSLPMKNVELFLL